MSSESLHDDLYPDNYLPVTDFLNAWVTLTAQIN